MMYYQIILNITIGIWSYIALGWSNVMKMQVAWYDVMFMSCAVYGSQLWSTTSKGSLQNVSMLDDAISKVSHTCTW